MFHQLFTLNATLALSFDVVYRFVLVGIRWERWSCYMLDSLTIERLRGSVNSSEEIERDVDRIK